MDNETRAGLLQCPENFNTGKYVIFLYKNEDGDFDTASQPIKREGFELLREVRADHPDKVVARVTEIIKWHRRDLTSLED